MSGVVCMPLLARGRVVCDLLRRRVAFVTSGDAEEEEEDGHAAFVPPFPLD